MSVMLLTKVFVAMIFAFLLVDLLWLGVIAKSFYRQELALHITDRFNWYAAITFYILFIAGMIFFSVIPAQKFDSWAIVALYGALYGLITYGTYDLTNLATLKNWPVILSFVDIIWGMFLSSLVTIIGVFVYRISVHN